MEQKRIRYQWLVLIATHKLCDKATEMFLESALPIEYRLNAEGTASSEIMDTLGLGSVDKTVIVSTVPEVFGKKMLSDLHSKLRLDAVGSGIAFTVPMTAANELLVRLMNSTVKEDENETEASFQMEKQYALISAIVNRGFSGEVMDAARGVGAGGGTVIHSRGIGSEDAALNWGLGTDEEKEIVLILAEHSKKNDIMKAVSEKCGMNSDAKGLVMALPVDSVMGI